MSDINRTDLRRSAMHALEYEILGELASDFARLMFLSSLFDTEANRYVDLNRAPRFGSEETEHAAAACHREIFARLCRIPVKELEGQLASWVSTDPEGFYMVVRDWSAKQAYLQLAPAGTSGEADADQFQKNLKLALDVIQRRPRKTPKFNSRPSV